MGVHIGDNKLMIITEPKTFHFDLPQNVDNFTHEIDVIIMQNELLGEHAIKHKIRQLLFKYNHGNDIHKHGKQ